MSLWYSRPNFDDQKARVNTRIHRESGAKIIEILYGAEDKNHNPVYPHPGKDSSGRSIDGHGHWVALEIDGKYQMLYWRRSYSLRIEGNPDLLGVQEYGESNEEHALLELENNIRLKEKLLYTTESIVQEMINLTKSSEALSKIGEVFQKLKEAKEKCGLLRNEWKLIQDLGTPREKELRQRFNDAIDKIQAAKKDFQASVDRKHTQNRDAKRTLVQEAVRLSDSEDWKQAGGRMKELMEQWKSIGQASKDDEAALWRDFSEARKKFADRRTQHYRELDAKRDKSRRTKLDLIDEAVSVLKAFTCTDPSPQSIRDTSDKLNTLMERWKAAGSAGKDNDNQLWEQFEKVRKDFFEKRKYFYEKRDKQRINNRAEKERICSEAYDIASSRDYSRENTERMKELDREWRAIGSAGEYDQSLWEKFSKSKESFWYGKRADSERRREEAKRKHEEWLQNARERISRKKEQISRLHERIENLRERLNRTRDYLTERKLSDWIYENNHKIEQLEQEIYDIEQKMRS